MALELPACPRSPPAELTQRHRSLLSYRVKVFDPEGNFIAHSGAAGSSGPGINPVQYNNVADTAFGGDGMVYISDGDGSSNHRVVALNVTESLESEVMQNPQWVMGNNNTKGAGGLEEYGHDITSAHSIAYHHRTNTLFLADRENNRTLHVSSKGDVIGNWTCPNLGHLGTVYGVRTSSALDLVFLAVADQNKANIAAGHPDQFLYILDGSKITGKGPGPCKIVQTIKVDPKRCMTPHLMGHNVRFVSLFGGTFRPLLLRCPHRPLDSFVVLKRIRRETTISTWRASASRPRC